MTVRWTMTLDDLVAGNRLLMSTFRRVGTGIGLAAILIRVVLVVSVSRLPGLIAIAYGFLDLAILWFTPIERALVRRNVAKLVGNTCEMTATPDGLEFRQDGLDGRYAWSSFTGIREDSQVLVLTSGRVTRVGIPKRAFVSDEEARSFRDYVMSQMAAATHRDE